MWRGPACRRALTGTLGGRPHCHSAQLSHRAGWLCWPRRGRHVGSRALALGSLLGGMGKHCDPEPQAGGPGGPEGQGAGLTEPSKVQGHLLSEISAHVVQGLVLMPLTPLGPVLEQHLPLAGARGPRAVRGRLEGALGTRTAGWGTPGWLVPSPLPGRPPHWARPQCCPGVRGTERTNPGSGLLLKQDNHVGAPGV